MGLIREERKGLEEGEKDASSFSFLGEETAEEEECGLSSSLSSLVLRSSATLSEISRWVAAGLDSSLLEEAILFMVEATPMSMFSMPMLPASLSSTAFSRFLLLALAGWGAVWRRGVSIFLLLLVRFSTKTGLLLLLLVLVNGGEGEGRHIGGRPMTDVSFDWIPRETSSWKTGASENYPQPSVCWSTGRGVNKMLRKYCFLGPERHFGRERFGKSLNMKLTRSILGADGDDCNVRYRGKGGGNCSAVLWKGGESGNIDGDDCERGKG